jgi:glutamyl/glutaminyl-tRNA synthetase
MIRTRFRPSANGRLHFGGALVARNNWWYARALGGQFVLIVDDVNPLFKYGDSPAVRESVHRYGELFCEDLEWLGCPPDLTVYASAYWDAHREAARQLGVSPCAYPANPSLQLWVQTPPGQCNEFTYSPWLTLGRVTDDHELGITGFVRGGDLVHESGLYDYFGRQLYGMGYSVWQQYHVIVVEPDGNVCSKSDGTTGIHAYREAGVTSEQINAALDNLLTLPHGYGRASAQYVQVDAALLAVAP